MIDERERLDADYVRQCFQEIGMEPGRDGLFPAPGQCCGLSAVVLAGLRRAGPVDDPIRKTAALVQSLFSGETRLRGARDAYLHGFLAGFDERRRWWGNQNAEAFHLGCEDGRAAWDAATGVA